MLFVNGACPFNFGKTPSLTSNPESKASPLVLILTRGQEAGLTPLRSAT